MDTVDADLALLDRWCAGDTAAGNDLFKRHFASVYAFFEHKAPGDIDDLVQETFLQCLRSRQTFKRQSTFKTYLFAIARHVLFQRFRRHATARPTLDFEEISIESLSTSVGTRLSKHIERARLLAVLRRLPVDQQLLLEGYYWEGFNRDELAEVFEVEPATIGSRLFRARQALHEGLEAGANEPPVADADLDAWARSLRRDRAPSAEGGGGGDDGNNGGGNTDGNNDGSNNNNNGGGGGGATA